MGLWLPRVLENWLPSVPDKRFSGEIRELSSGFLAAHINAFPVFSA